MKLNNDWDTVLEEEFNKSYFNRITQFLDEEYKNNIVYPKQEDIYNALRYTTFKDAKVVILGQDPYHGTGQAHGLAFSVNPGIKSPPSLVNIYKELHDDIGCYIPNNGCLTKWTNQGVLLLNSVLTVRANTPTSHANIRWQYFTDKIISLLNDKCEPVVFILWGNYAKSKKYLITNKQHFILEAAHPSPFSAHSGFFGCKHFSKANRFLKESGIQEIDWQIENI